MFQTLRVREIVHDTCPCDRLRNDENRHDLGYWLFTCSLHFVMHVIIDSEIMRDKRYCIWVDHVLVSLPL